MRETTHVSLTTPTQNKPTMHVTPPANKAAPSASLGAPIVCATNRYVSSANGKLNVSGEIVRRASGAVSKKKGS